MKKLPVYRKFVTERCQEIGMTKMFLAKQMGISPSQLSQTLAGGRELKPEEEEIMKRLLKIDTLPAKY